MTAASAGSEQAQILAAELDGARRDLELALARERETVARLREVEELKRQFLSNVSHELRTPLTSIRGYAALLEKKLDVADAPVHRALEAILRATQQLDRLIEDLLDVAAAESGRLRIRASPVDLAEAVRSAAVQAGPAAQEKSIQVDVAIHERIPAVQADSGRLAQVLANVIDNALKYTPRGGAVTIEVHRGGAVAHAIVRDTGVGIPLSEQETVFSHFFRASAGRDARRGTGLGLAIARAIVEAHAGLMWLESEVGKGTAVHFTIPLVEAS
jgi:signal transduction histidine kinase